MKISLGVLAQAFPALKKLLNADLPITTSYSLSKVIAAIETEIQRFEQERIKLVKKHGETDEKGDTEVKPDKMPDFLKDLTTLAQIETTLDFEPISLDELKDVKMSAIDVANLSAFLKAQ